MIPDEKIRAVADDLISMAKYNLENHTKIPGYKRFYRGVNAGEASGYRQAADMLLDILIEAREKEIEQ